MVFFTLKNLVFFFRLSGQGPKVMDDSVMSAVWMYRYNKDPGVGNIVRIKMTGNSLRVMFTLADHCHALRVQL